MEENQNQVLKLELTVAEINVVLNSLGMHPFREVSMLIQKIKQQGESQLQELNNIDSDNETTE